MSVWKALKHLKKLNNDIKGFMRKPKYLEVEVGGKKYTFYHIIWEDITGDAGHKSTSEILRDNPAVKNTFGFIIEENENHLKTASTYDEQHDEWSDNNIFPIGCVINKKKLEIR
jgi:hypothetical protein|tara:strand:- start:456 stop:797 length:342 start_codon:yes stop_codon:yes gene_type:complete